MPSNPRMSDIVTEPELRRYLRSASTLLATAAGPSVPRHPHERIHALRLARHWIRAALLGAEQLLREAEASPDGDLEDQLTTAVDAPTIRVAP